MTPKGFDSSRSLFENAFLGRYLDIHMDDGNRYCVTYKNQGCDIKNTVTGSTFLNKVCFTLTASSPDFFFVDIICDEKRDGIEEDCQQSNAEGSNPESLGTIGRLSSQTEPKPQQGEFIGSGPDSAATPPPSISMLSVVENPDFCIL